MYGAHGARSVCILLKSAQLELYSALQENMFASDEVGRGIAPHACPGTSKDVSMTGNL